MKSFTVLILVAAVACPAYGGPAGQDRSLVRHRRQLISSWNQVLGNYEKLIENLLQNLQTAAKQASDAVLTFKNGVEEQTTQCRQKFTQDLAKFRTRVTDAIQSVSDRFSSSGSAVSECITSHRTEAEALLQETLKKTTTCAGQRVEEARELIEGLNTISTNANEFAAAAFAEMRNCTSSNSENMLSMGSCLGRVIIRTEMKGAVMLTQSGLMIARLNLYMATLPSALEVCAGTGLVQAGLGTARIVMDIGSCSASSIFSTMSGSSGSSSTASVVATSISEVAAPISTVK